VNATLKSAARWFPNLIASGFKILKCLRILRRDFGFGLSARKRSVLDARGCPLPWYTYPAIEYLLQMDFRERRVFEYGSGNSSLFWAARSREVTSVENNRLWVERVNILRPPNLLIKLFETREAYVSSLLQEAGTFDVIIVDGSYRNDCAATTVRKLSAGGLVILDNADWFPRAAERLRNAGLLEVDLKGFGPLNSYTWTTSLFFHRDFNLRSLDSRQPTPGWGSSGAVVEE
jgi:hypothetical protein